MKLQAKNYKIPAELSTWNRMERTGKNSRTLQLRSFDFDRVFFIRKTN